jgi:hypothetical protein
MTKEEILQVLDSWENLEYLLKEIMNSPKDYQTLMEIALNSKDPKSWRAAYLVDKINDSQSELLHPYLVRMFEQVQIEKNGSKKRHFLKLISMNNIPENHQGVMFDFCLKAFSSDKEAVAIRVHAMQILYNISINEPDLQAEVLSIIEHEIEHHPSPGIASRGKKLIKNLRLGNTIKG